MRKNYFLMLKIPPPFGGGEVRSKLLHEHYKNNPDFFIYLYKRKTKNKINQGKIRFLNIYYGLLNLIESIYFIILYKPKILYTILPKSLLTFYIKITPYFLVSKFLNYKIIGDIAGAELYFLGKNSLFDKIHLTILKSFQKIRVLSQSTLVQYQKIGLTNVIFMRNGINIPNYDFSKNCNKISFLFVGSLTKDKGFDLVLQAYRNLQKKYSNIELNIIGGIQEKCIYEESFGLKFHGILDGKEKYRIFANSDVFVLPSYKEGQPISIIESLAFGLIIIASNVGGIPDIIENNTNGFLLDNISVEEIESKMGFVITNIERMEKIKKNNISLYKEMYTADAYLKSMDSLFQI